MKENTNNILKGNIKKTLISLAVPIVMSNLIQTVLGIVDMIWVGKLGSDAVTAIGTASFYINLATALTTLICVGTGVKIAQAIGSGSDETKVYIKNGFILSILISLGFVLIVCLNADRLISFFGMKEAAIENMSRDYLIVSMVGVPLLFMITYLTTVFTSYGETKITLKANSIGLILNIMVDPIFIFGFSFIPKMGVMGAAWATNLARLVILMLLFLNLNKEMKESVNANLNMSKIIEVIRMSLPVTAQRVVFIYISMIMAKIIVQFGTEAMAVQKIGVQIESISYVTIGGLQGAIATFVGQNYGNKNIDRIKQGYAISTKMVVLFGVFVSIIMIAFSKQIFSIFINDRSVIEGGVGYMRAIGFSQLFMCLELLTVGAFNGIGKTFVPPLVSVTITVLRIPMALFLSAKMGLEGVWWSISITSILKGIILYVWFKFVMKREGSERLCI